MVICIPYNIARVSTSLAQWCTSHLLVAPTQGLCSNYRHQVKGHHMPFGWCAYQGLHNPYAWWRTNNLFWALLFVVATRKILGHLTMKWLSQHVDCDGYSFVMAAYECSMESLRSPPSVFVVCCQPGDQQRL